ncbi:MAG: EscU/YscU/HrcU family type III secretion system export apparatus switch protein [Treponema sp.]|jgi:type III secretion system FlhB-like substrate exporter|nr:EscU/YscU/HrcU family type III secretion system export apparatus switch protein [Treponema sp.]
MKKRKIASAIGYSPDDPAPVFLISGKGSRAERIIAIAQESGIEVVQDAALAALLDEYAKPGDFIPPWCWEATAKILAFVMKTENTSKTGVFST